MTDLSWVTKLPAGVMYAIIGFLALLILLPFIIVLFRGIKYKKEKPSGEKVEIEIDGIAENDEEKPAAPVVKA